jgi:predicted DNA-binding protein with PD1-like motif
MERRKIDNGYMVRCDIGDEVVSAMTAFAAENNIHSGTISGIGAVKDVVLGYFDLSKKEYIRREFDGVYELLSLNGNFARLDDDTILHCHAVISDIDFNVFGGHLFSGVIAVTGEFYIRPGSVEINRGPDKNTGLNLIRL